MDLSDMSEGRKLWHWLVLATLSLIWGTSYILMKKGLESFSTYQVASLRVLISFLCLLPMAIRSLPKLTKDNLLSIIIIGFFGSGIPAFLFPQAQTRIDSSVAGMLNSLSPVFTLIMGIVMYKRKAIRSQVAGVFLGLIGAAGLLYSGSFTFNYYGLFVVLATLLYGISSNEVSKVQGLNGLEITSLAFFILGPFALVLLLLTDLQAPLETENWLRNFGFIAVLSVFGSAFALILFYRLIKDTSPVFASMTTYFIPIVATIWGLSDNEHLTSSILVSVLLILAGVYLINRPAILGRIKSKLK
ncbi:MAG: DMT family transporter [Bacteroidia bacterium]|nr:DMT family transporter [Bacteroidia bacterium]